MWSSARAPRASTTRSAAAARRPTSRSATAVTGASSSRTPELLLAVVLVEVGGDRVYVFLRNRRAEGIDHLVHGRSPAGLVEEARIHLDVVQAVAGEALHRLVAARRVFQHHFLFLRQRGRAHQQKNEKGAHQITSTYRRWITLW